MPKPTLDIYVSAEASDDEKSVVAESFDGFEVSLRKGEYRFSETVLSLVVSIFLGVVSAAVYDLLKAGVKKLRRQPKSKIGRDIEVKIRKSQAEYIITRDVFVARENTEEKHFSSVDELFDDLQRDQSKHGKDHTSV
jgi:hypothetical protein